MFWKRKKSAKQIGREIRQDFEKTEWFERMLSEEEQDAFIIAQEISMFYDKMIRDKEPHAGRSEKMQRQMHRFRKQIKEMIRRYPIVEKTERELQVEELIRKAQFQEDYRFIPKVYWYLVRLSNQERGEWVQFIEEVSHEFYGPIQS